MPEPSHPPADVEPDSGPPRLEALPPVAPTALGRRVGRFPLANLVLFAASFVTMTMAGAYSATGEILALSEGLSYSLCLVAILGAHEMGHYLACRHYGVDASLPYFLPSFPAPMGTFGAFIRIRAPIPSRKVLFDIGVAGPIAGFVVTLPVLVLGVLSARMVTVPDTMPMLDEPLLMSWAGDLLTSGLPDRQAMLLSGPLMAAYVGCLATAFNLFPIGQLDGGHLCYALSPRFHRLASFVCLGAFVLMGLLVFPGWLFLATLLFMFGPKHPPVIDDAEGLSRGRVVVAILSLLILLVCFIPRPFFAGDL